MLHGISLSHVTSNAKDQVTKEEVHCPFPLSCAEGKFNFYSDSDDELTVSDPKTGESLVDGASREIGTAWDDDTTSSSSTASSSSDPYDVIGELSINPNSVEETLLRIWQNDPDLTEVRKSKTIVC